MKYPKVDGLYVIDGGKFKILTGSRAQVWHSTAYKTTGGLLKEDLLKNKHGEIVSKKKHEQESKDSNLIKHGYSFKKDGTFGYEKIKGLSGVTARKRSTKSTTARKSKAASLEGLSDQQGGGFNVEDNTLPGLAATAAQFGGRHSRRRKHKGGGSSTFSPDTLYGGRRRSKTHNRKRAMSSSLAGGYAGTSNLFL